MNNIKIGDIFYNEYNKKCYIVHLLLEEKSPQIIYKWYKEYKKYWQYKIEPLSTFHLGMELGTYHA